MTINLFARALATIAMAMVAFATWAQQPEPPANDATKQEAAPAVDHSQMQHDVPAGKTNDEHAGHGGNGGSIDHGSMQGGKAPPDARDPHAYSGGYDFGPLPLHLADQHNFGSLRVDNLEVGHERGHTSLGYDLQGWYGRSYDRLVLKAEGEADDGKLDDARTELLWGHAVASYWDAQLGVRYDSGASPDRTWLAFGVQGLAPYWFELDVAAYVGEDWRSALRLDADYELLLTQKLILQPRVEANWYGKSDTGRGLGKGLSDVAVGLRLRYEIRREFAPYVGIEWAGRFGDTADLARAAGQDKHETRLVAGLRFWFAPPPAMK